MGDAVGSGPVREERSPEGGSDDERSSVFHMDVKNARVPVPMVSPAPLSPTNHAIKPNRDYFVNCGNAKSAMTVMALNRPCVIIDA